MKLVANIFRIASLATVSLFWNWITLPKATRLWVATIITALVALFAVSTL
jgi:hypothetical protein